VIFIGAAVLTPPDVFTQTLMAGPLIILYEISILVSQIAGRKEESPERAVPKVQEQESKT
jgi:sec-independent protein translocase protein TatC